MSSLHATRSYHSVPPYYNSAHISCWVYFYLDANGVQRDIGRLPRLECPLLQYFYLPPFYSEMYLEWHDANQLYGTLRLLSCLLGWTRNAACGMRVDMIDFLIYDERRIATNTSTASNIFLNGWSSLVFNFTAISWDEKNVVQIRAPGPTQHQSVEAPSNVFRFHLLLSLYWNPRVILGFSSFKSVMVRNSNVVPHVHKQTRRGACSK